MGFYKRIFQIKSLIRMADGSEDVAPVPNKEGKRLETEFAETEAQSVEHEPSTELPTGACQLLVTNFEEGNIHEVVPNVPPESQLPDALSPSASSHQVIETSPSFRSLHPGHVSSISDFWENIWKIENDYGTNVFARGGRSRDHGVGNGVNLTIDDEGEELNRLKETVMIQCQLLKVAEQENDKLRGKIDSIELMNKKILKDLNEKSEKRENLVIDLRAKLEEYEKDVSDMNDKDLVKKYKILELEDKLTESRFKLDVSRQENVSLKNQLKEVDSKLNHVEADHAKLKEKVSSYEEVVKDLKKQVVPMENIKLKMASLDEDVCVLKRRLQGSMRNKSTVKNSNTEEVVQGKLLMPYCTSTKKRRVSPIDGQVGSPAKIIKVAIGSVHEEIDRPAETGAEVDSDKCDADIGTGNITSDFDNTRMRSLKKSRSRIGQECKQQ